MLIQQTMLENIQVVPVVNPIPNEGDGQFLSLPRVCLSRLYTFLNDFLTFPKYKNYETYN